MAATKINLAELIDKLPPTDLEIEAQKAAEKSPTEQPKPKGKPREDHGSKFTGPDPDVANKMCEDILAGGRASVIELIGLSRDPAGPDFKNYKADYLLHCLTIYVGRPDREAQRKLFREALAAQIGNPALSAHTRNFLIRELQFVGDRSSAKALGALLLDSQFGEAATAALLAIGDGAVEQFRAALPKAEGKGRLFAIQNLAVLKDAQSAAVFQRALTDDESDVRLAGAWGLARLADASAIPGLLKLADGAQGYERTKATQHCLVLAENLLAAGRKDDASRIYGHLRTTRTDPKEQYIRDLANKALDAIGGKVL